MLEEVETRADEAMTRNKFLQFGSDVVKHFSNVWTAFKELAEPQKRNGQTVKQVAEAQKRADNTVGELAQAQKGRTRELRNLLPERGETKELFSRLSSASGENQGHKALPEFLHNGRNL